MSKSVGLHITRSSLIAILTELLLQHQLLQGIRNLPQLYAINVPYITKYGHTHPNPEDLAQYLAVMLTMRPEIRLKYAGISNMCFEFWEHRGGDTDEHRGGDTDEHRGGDTDEHRGGDTDDQTASSEADPWDPWAAPPQTGGNNSAPSDGSDVFDEGDDDYYGIDHIAPHQDGDDNHQGASSDLEDNIFEDDTQDEDEGFFYEPEGQVVIRTKEIPFPVEKVEIYRVRRETW